MLLGIHNMQLTMIDLRFLCIQFNGYQCNFRYYCNMKFWSPYNLGAYIAFFNIYQRIISRQAYNFSHSTRKKSNENLVREFRKSILRKTFPSMENQHDIILQKSFSFLFYCRSSCSLLRKWIAVPTTHQFIHQHTPLGGTFIFSPEPIDFRRKVTPLHLSQWSQYHISIELENYLTQKKKNK